VSFLISRDDIDGAVNLATPSPLPQREFMRELRGAWGVPAGLPATRWMAAIGAFALRSDTELLLKSRYVLPGRLTSAGFAFGFPAWPAAAADLVKQARALRHQAKTPPGGCSAYRGRRRVRSGKDA
jgi:NAD dependent epimerase/dehydratase family enzyme